MSRRLSRRELLKYGITGFGLAALGGSGAYRVLSGGASLARADDEAEFRTPIKFTPFTRALPVPPVKQAGSSFTPQHCTLPPVSGLSNPKFYTVSLRQVTAEIIPGFPQTVVWGYDGMYPGPTFRVNHNVPAIVRFTNNITGVNTIVHNHGGHTSSETDGSYSGVPFPVPGPGQAQDCFYGSNSAD